MAQETSWNRLRRLNEEWADIIKNKIIKKFLAVVSSVCVCTCTLTPAAATTKTDYAILGGTTSLKVSVNYYYYNRTTRVVTGKTISASSSQSQATVGKTLSSEYKMMDAVSQHLASTSNQNWECKLEIGN